LCRLYNIIIEFIFRQKYSFCHFLPASCLRKIKRARKVVIAAFDKFYNSDNPLSDGKLKLKYLEIAEKSSVLEYHTCQALMVSHIDIISSRTKK